MGNNWPPGTFGGDPFNRAGTMYAEPLPRSSYVTFPGEYSTPRTGSAWRPSGVGSMQTIQAEARELAGYGKWLRRTKWLGPGAAAAAALAAAWKAWELSQGEPGAVEGATAPGVAWPPGWTVTCSGGTDGMPYWGPYAGYAGYPVGTCGSSTAIDPGRTWYDKPSDGFEPLGASPGLYDHGNGNYSCFFIHQVKPSPLSSPEIWITGPTGTIIGGLSVPAPKGPVLERDLAPFGLPADPWAQPPAEVAKGPMMTPEPGAKAWPGTSPEGAPGPWGEGYGGPLPSPSPTPSPGAGPFAPPVRQPPGGRVRVRFLPGPPRVRERERKWLAPAPIAKVLKWFGIVTEFVDFFEAAWWSMSKGCRARAFKEYGHRLTFVERAAFTLSNPGCVNIPKTLLNWADANAGDTQAGQSGKFTREMHRRWYEFTGFDLRGRGPVETWHHFTHELGDVDLFGQ